jgi:hypothetical protein
MTQEERSHTDKTARHLAGSLGRSISFRACRREKALAQGMTFIPHEAITVRKQVDAHPAVKQNAGQLWPQGKQW